MARPYIVRTNGSHRNQTEILNEMFKLSLQRKEKQYIDMDISRLLTCLWAFVVLAIPYGSSPLWRRASRFAPSVREYLARSYDHPLNLAPSLV
ncbi:hypothetical protein C8R44DRAFT_973261 [Mycena epipterygia]|nr:hypothetical protein C8R44DRAFT_973261 [Mycena epipterygia]